MNNFEFNGLNFVIFSHDLSSLSQILHDYVIYVTWTVADNHILAKMESISLAVHRCQSGGLTAGTTMTRMVWIVHSD